jgi:hypothetical protein
MTATATRFQVRHDDTHNVSIVLDTDTNQERHVVIDGLLAQMLADKLNQLEEPTMQTTTQIDASWTPSYASWRHGGYYVTNIRYASGSCGCVSNNYPDRKWRIVCGDESRTYRTRDDAAYAEYFIAEQENQATMTERCETHAAILDPQGYCDLCNDEMNARIIAAEEEAMRQDTTDQQTEAREVLKGLRTAALTVQGAINDRNGSYDLSRAYHHINAAATLLLRLTGQETCPECNGSGRVENTAMKVDGFGGNLMNCHRCNAAA